MDFSHHRDLAALGVPPERLLMFRAFDPEGDGDVPDPYYGGPQGFDDVLAMIERTADVIADALVVSTGSTTRTRSTTRSSEAS